MRKHADFDEFYEANYGRMVALVTSVIGDRIEAEDVVQDAFARALARWTRPAATTFPRRGSGAPLSGSRSTPGDGCGAPFSDHSSPGKAPGWEGCQMRSWPSCATSCRLSKTPPSTERTIRKRRTLKVAKDAAKERKPGPRSD